MYIFMGLLLIGSGWLLLRGAIRRWEWLVDPPTEFWFCYSQSLLKLIFGSEGCRALTIAMGAMFLAIGALILVVSFFRLIGNQ